MLMASGWYPILFVWTVWMDFTCQTQSHALNAQSIVLIVTAHLFAWYVQWHTLPNFNQMGIKYVNPVQHLVCTAHLRDV